MVDYREKRQHERLEVWKDAMELVTLVYRLTFSFPAEEKFGITSQIRRASVSIPSNIAEGAARTSKKDFYRYLGIARGSLAELETQLQIAHNLGYLPACNEAYKLTNRVFAKLSALMKHLQTYQGETV